MTAVDAEPWTYRLAVVDDLQFVWETTLKVRKPHGVSWRDWRGLHGAKLLDELVSDNGRITVCDGGNGVIVGYAWRTLDGSFSIVTDAAGEPVRQAEPQHPVLRMLYVKRDLRGNGIGLQLLHAAGVVRDGSPIEVYRPNPCWRRWADHHRINWEATR